MYNSNKLIFSFLSSSFTFTVSTLIKYSDLIQSSINELSSNQNVIELCSIQKGGKGFNNILNLFDRYKRKRIKNQKLINNLKLEENKLKEENKRSFPIILFYRNKLKRTKVNVEQGLKVALSGSEEKQFVLVGELNTI